jgi:DNA end-binding protein Ku
MERTHRAGIATFVMRGKEYLVAILSENGILSAETLRFADEIRSPASVGLPKARKPDVKAVRAMEKWIAGHEAKTIPRKELTNREADQLRRLAEKKAARRKDVVGRAKRGKDKAAVVDLLDVLRQSLESSAKPRKAASGAK